MTAPANRTTWVPNAKVTGGGAAGAVTTIVLWALEQFAHLPLPTPVAAAVGVLIAIGAAYLIPGARSDRLDVEGGQPGVDERPLTIDERQRIRRAWLDEAARLRNLNG